MTPAGVRRGKRSGKHDTDRHGKPSAAGMRSEGKPPDPSSCFVKGVFTFLEMLVYSVPVSLEAPRQSMAYLCICLHIRGIVLVHSAT